MLREIIRLKQRDHSHKEISRILGISRTTIVNYVKKLSATGIAYTELLSRDDESLWESVHGPPGDNIPQEHKRLYDRFSGYKKELTRPGVTLKSLWETYIKEDPMGVQYSRFCFHYGRWRSNKDAYMPKKEKAGDKLYVDFAGKKLQIVDPSTGEIKDMEVFVGVLGCSGKIYAEACYSQKSEDFLRCMENCLRFFGGVPRAIIPDNLKSAVTKSSLYEPNINRHLTRFATHFDTAIIPTRSNKPKDKPLVENGVIMIYQGVYAPIRNVVFHTEKDLNLAILKQLDKINTKPMQKWPYSRQELFEQLDKPALQPLTITPFEIIKIKWLTVQKNCHIELTDDKSYYSAPSAYMGKKVKVVYSRSTVEIYSGHKRIAFHKRSARHYVYVTLDDHMPSTHRFVAEWSKDKFLEWGEMAGEHTLTLFKGIFQRKDHPEQAYKSCLGLLSLGKKYGNHRLDKACSRAIHFGAYNYKTVKNILEQKLDEQALQTSLKLNIPSHENIRGSSYYH